MFLSCIPFLAFFISFFESKFLSGARFLVIFLLPKQLWHMWVCWQWIFWFCLIVCLFLIYFWSIFLLDMQFLVDLFFCFFKYFKGITTFSSNFIDFWLEVCYKYFLPLCVMFFWSFFPPSHCFQDFLSFFFFSSLFLAFFSRCTHSSVLAWRIPGIGERGGLPSVGLHRIGHDWRDLAAAAAACSCKEDQL